MLHRLHVYQFIARGNVSNGPIGVSWVGETAETPRFELDLEIIDKPFETNFIEVIPKRPSIGAHQYVDPEVDLYMRERWPKCIHAQGELETDADVPDELVRDILRWAKLSVWEVRTFRGLDLCDQVARRQGYRRAYFTRPMLDFEGNRVPCSREYYVSTEPGEMVGPGLALFEGLRDRPSEAVWSQIIPFAHQTGTDEDLAEVLRKARGIQLHYNSYNELSDARRHLSNGEVKAAVRAAASAVETSIKYYAKQWGVRYRRKNPEMTFVDRIEAVLAESGQPSFQEANPEAAERILYLYRARNAMHEGDCMYKDRQGVEIRVTKVSQADELVRAAEDFALWIDALA